MWLEATSSIYRSSNFNVEIRSADLAHIFGCEVVRIRTLLSKLYGSMRERHENRLARHSQEQLIVGSTSSAEHHPFSRHEREAMILKELMREILEAYTLTESGRISSAADIMRDKRVGSIVIVDDSECVVGITDRDIGLLLAL